jgi:hypothetical protein
MFLQNLRDLELDFGYVVLHAMTGHHTKICTKLLKGSFCINYLVMLINLPR